MISISACLNPLLTSSKLNTAVAISLFLFLTSCKPDATQPDQQQTSNPPGSGSVALADSLATVDSQATIDSQATMETKALLWNLKKLSGRYLLFGHQDDLAYGYTWSAYDSNADQGQSDVKAVTGAYPAISGWDLGHLERGKPTNLDNVNFAQIQQWIRDTYQRGGISTISWHMDDPVSGNSSWHKESVVEHIIPGGKAHQKFKQFLDQFARFNAELKVSVDGIETPIPIIFRPWHEHSGDWFWWGKGNTSEADYIKLWQFTVEYLRDKKNIHNLLYAYSPDRSRINLDHFEQDYLWGYPGDDYVDILGIDNYHDFRIADDIDKNLQQQDLIRSLESLADIATQKNKLAALTEGGQETLPDSTFWTDRLLAGVLASPKTKKIAFVTVWRNADHAKENREHFYAPYPGHPSAKNFVEFYNHPFVMFQDNLPNLYSF